MGFQHLPSLGLFLYFLPPPIPPLNELIAFPGGGVKLASGGGGGLEDEKRLNQQGNPSPYSE